MAHQICLTENVEFRDLLHTADARYNVPSRTVIAKELEGICIEMKAKISCYIQQANKICLCTDIWSKKGLASSYLGITGHFFSPKDNRRHCVTLAVRRMPASHTAINIRHIFEDVLSEWEIPNNKISAILTDNGSNIVAAFKSHFSTIDGDGEDEDIDKSYGIEDDGDDKSNGIESEADEFDDLELDHAITFSSFKRVSCFAHTLQLVVRQFDGIATFKDLLKRTHHLVSKVNKSTKATEKLISLCGKKLIRDCPTRWSSTFLVIERLLLVKTSLSSVLEEFEWDNLATSEWKYLEAIRALLQPFAQFTSLISGEEFTTLSSVLPAIMDINLHLEEVRHLCFS